MDKPKPKGRFRPPTYPYRHLLKKPPATTYGGFDEIGDLAWDAERGDFVFRPGIGEPPSHEPGDWRPVKGGKRPPKTFKESPKTGPLRPVIPAPPPRRSPMMSLLQLLGME